MGGYLKMLTNISGIIITSLNTIWQSDGNIRHVIKKGDIGYINFGEAYFSNINKNSIKAWKKHKQMTCNLVVPSGYVRFVMYDDRSESSTKGMFDEVILSEENYKRLTIPPDIWFGFQSIKPITSIILNIASIKHNPDEVVRKGIEEIYFNWGL